MARILCTRQSRDDLVAIRDYIAKDAPRTADAFVRKLVASTKPLRRFPYQLNRDDIREIYCKSYRIIYRVRLKAMEILTVYRASRLLDESIVPDEPPE